MYRSERRAFCTLMLALLLMLSCTAGAQSQMQIPPPTDCFYVNDFSGLLDEETASYIENINVELYAATGAQVVVVTLPSLNGASLEEFSTALFRQYGIGSKEKNNGVLMLIALEEREFRIEVGYGLEGALNDAKTGRISDKRIIPHLKENRWNEGIRDGFDAIVAEIEAEYGITLSVPEAPKPAEPEPPKEEYWPDALNNALMILMGLSVAFGIFTGKVCPNYAIIPNLFWLAAGFLYIASCYNGLGAFVSILGNGIFLLIGWAIGSPDTGGSSSGSSYYSGSSYSSSSRSSSYSSHSSSSGSHHSGGGGRSGGGGSSRKF